MEVGRRLVAEKILQNIDEIGFISYEDILSYTAKEHSPWELFSRNKINLNRRKYSINQQIPTPPLTFISHWNPTTVLTDKSLKDESLKDVLVGLGSSQGKIIGKARIIINLEEQIDEFEPGEIIVTRFTDTTWTPLFYIASAVVADIGSLLSHSSIVARELGIPAVVNTKIATQAISTGDTLIVDGNKGEVYLKKDSDAPNSLISSS
jgi:pyruvate,water dikinase